MTIKSRVIKACFTKGYITFTLSKNGKIKNIADMNHVLKEVKGDLKAQMSSYFDPKIPMHKDLGNIILKFCLKPVQNKEENKSQ